MLTIVTLIGVCMLQGSYSARVAMLSQNLLFLCSSGLPDMHGVLTEKRFESKGRRHSEPIIFRPESDFIFDWPVDFSISYHSMGDFRPRKLTIDSEMLNWRFDMFIFSHSNFSWLPPRSAAT